VLVVQNGQITDIDAISMAEMERRYS
jgi:hypothetical protein